MLIYDIQSELLHGDVGSQHFRVHAVSGGGRGSYLKPEGDELLRSWSFLTKEEASKSIRGGIIPPGPYVCRYVANHSTFHECIYLEQTVASLLVPDPASPAGIKVHDRGGFYIHGSGPKGSDGCIVVRDKQERLRLNKAIKTNGATLLRVVHPFLPDDLSSRRRTAVV